MTEAYLARAECGLGNRAAAVRWAVAARGSAATYTTPATPLVLARMEAELAAAVLRASMPCHDANDASAATLQPDLR
jgi:hypothetical protein